jgi:phage tail sheath protein FI
MAGIYARSDTLRGVFKAPANESVRGALGIEKLLTRGDQEQLNPAGVNAIRYFATGGVLAYGARTLDESSSEWKYVNVRRLFIMLEQSIVRGTQWVVFEPNDQSLWKAIIRDVSAFLRTIWASGALMGRTPAEAFFVKCDEENNPRESIDAGRVVITIGVAPVKPAEFVIFRIGQQASGATIES